MFCFEDNSSLKYDKLVIASGSHPKMVNWPGGATKGIQGLFNLKDLDDLENNKEIDFRGYLKWNQ